MQSRFVRIFVESHYIAQSFVFLYTRDVDALNSTHKFKNSGNLLLKPCELLRRHFKPSKFREGADIDSRVGHCTTIRMNQVSVKASRVYARSHGLRVPGT